MGKASNLSFKINNNIDDYKVKHMLIDDETVICEVNEFKYSAPKESIVGKKKLFITSLMRLFTFDDGGILGQRQTYAAALNIVYNKNSLELSCCAQGEFNASFYINLIDYSKLRALSINKLEKFEIPALIESMGAYSESIIELTEDALIIKREKNINYSYASFINKKIINRNEIELRWNFISEIVSVNDMILVVKVYSEFDDGYVKLLIHYLDKETIEDIIKIYNSIPKDKLMINNIVKSSEPKSNDKIYSLDINDLSKEDTFSSEIKYIKVLVNYENHILRIYDWLTFQIKYEIDLEKSHVIRDTLYNNVFIHIYDKEDIISITKKELFEYFNKYISSEYKGHILRVYDNETRCLNLTIGEESIKIKDNHVDENIYYSEISDIYLNKFHGENYKVAEIMLKNNTEDILVYIDEEDYYKILHKKINVESNKITTKKVAFYEWGKNINDICVYYFFSLPIKLQEYIDLKLSPNKCIDELSKEDKVEIVNTIYFTLKAYKGVIREFSTYFLDELYLEQKKDYDLKYRDKFILVQRQLQEICNKVLVHTSDSVRNLNNIYTCIYPDLNISEELNKLTRNQSKIAASIYTGIGILTGGIAIVAGGVNTYSAFNNKKRQEIINGAEEAKINIFLNNSIEDFHVLTHIMLPKYVDEIKMSIYKFLISIESTYNEQDVEFLKFCINRNKLFLETPIDGKVICKKSVVINTINQISKNHNYTFIGKSSRLGNSVQLKRSEYVNMLEGSK